MGLYLKQLLAGRDFAKADRFAISMANYVYVLGDEETRDCVVVDPAWDVQGVLDCIDQDGLNLIGVLVTHYHPDHIGGTIWEHTIEGLSALMTLQPVPVHVNKYESAGIQSLTGLSESDLVLHEGGDELRIGNMITRFLHTPGHTPGSQCFLIGSQLISGDTLFIGGCGRVDLPGGDPTQMYYSLTQVLANLPDETILYPGHNYASEPSSTIGKEKQFNHCMRISSLEDWQALMGTK